LQDEIVAQLANMLNTQLVTVEASRAERTSNPDAMDYYFQGRAWLDKGKTRETLSRAGEFFERALTADANNSQALGGLALCHATDLQLGWPAAEVDYDSKVLGLADQALALDRENTLAHLAKAGYLNIRDRQTDARRIIDEGLAIDPSEARKGKILRIV
jgi:hypothetical protein